MTMSEVAKFERAFNCDLLSGDLGRGSVSQSLVSKMFTLKDN